MNNVDKYTDCMTALLGALNTASNGAIVLGMSAKKHESIVRNFDKVKNAVETDMYLRKLGSPDSYVARFTRLNDSL